MSPSDTNDENLAARRKRVRYRAWHRGMREMDLVLGHYVDAYIEGLDDGALDRLETLMNEQDADLLKWVLGQEPAPEDVDSALVDELSRFQQRRGKG